MLRKPFGRRSGVSNPDSGASRRGAPRSLVRLGLTIGALCVIDAVALALAMSLAADGLHVAAAALLVVTGLFNWVFLSERAYPLRWLAPGVVLTLLLVVYPLVYTVHLAFTNYSDGHLLTKEQVVAQLERQHFATEGAADYTWRAYRSPDGRFTLWLTDASGQVFLASAETGLQPLDPADPRLGPTDSEDGLPSSIGDAGKLGRLESVRYLPELEDLSIPVGDDTIRITSLDAAARERQKYTYDPDRDVLIDFETGTEYRPIEGSFTAVDGTTISPGFVALVGPRNFVRAFTDPQILGPFLGVFTWTFAFAGLSVLFVFTVGLALALVLNERRLPLRGIYRALIIVPYTIPGFISALVWVGLLNPLYGPINLGLQSLIGVSPPWFSDGTLAKAAILLVNTWLGYPYMLLVSLGALQSIPGDLYESAQIDGASRRQQFRFITLPLLLVSVAPLLIGAFAFNFNNFAVIDLVTEGGPPTPGWATPAGQTDILISYTYRLAFAGGRGSDYAFSAAISIFIFFIIAAITIFNFRFTRSFEKVSENV